jgi:hypothetical protein
MINVNRYKIALDVLYSNVLDIAKSFNLDYIIRDGNHVEIIPTRTPIEAINTALYDDFVFDISPKTEAEYQIYIDTANNTDIDSVKVYTGIKYWYEHPSDFVKQREMLQTSFTVLNDLRWLNKIDEYTEDNSSYIFEITRTATGFPDTVETIAGNGFPLSLPSTIYDYDDGGGVSDPITTTKAVRVKIVWSESKTLLENVKPIFFLEDQDSTPTYDYTSVDIPSGEWISLPDPPQVPIELGAVHNTLTQNRWIFEYRKFEDMQELINLIQS